MDSNIDGKRVLPGCQLQTADKGAFRSMLTQAYGLGWGRSDIVGCFRKEKSLDIVLLREDLVNVEHKGSRHVRAGHIRAYLCTSCHSLAHESLTLCEVVAHRGR